MISFALFSAVEKINLHFSGQTASGKGSFYCENWINAVTMKTGIFWSIGRSSRFNALINFDKGNPRLLCF